MQIFNGAFAGLSRIEVVAHIHLDKVGSDVSGIAKARKDCCHDYRLLFRIWELSLADSIA